MRDHRARAAAPPLTLLDAGTVTVAVPLTWPVPAGDGIAARRLAAVPRMACTVHSGPYGGLAHRLRQMRRWLRDTGHYPAGPVREVYLRFGAEPDLALPPAYLTDRGADLVTELQVPLASPVPPSDAGAALATLT